MCAQRRIARLLVIDQPTRTTDMNATPTASQRTFQSVSPSAPRPDLYAAIHKALRYHMGDTLGRIGRMDVFDEVDFADALAQLDALLELCENHVVQENRFMHTAIEARQPGASARVGDDHTQHLEHIAELRAEAALLRGAAAAGRAAPALRLYRHLALFVAANLQHMHIEETALNGVLWAHYDDAELQALRQRLLDSIEPRETQQVMRWMVPALNPIERAATLGAIKLQASPESFVALLAQIRPFLEVAAWHKLARALGADPHSAQCAARS
jgi:hypothetical protein